MPFAKFPLQSVVCRPLECVCFKARRLVTGFFDRTALKPLQEKMREHLDNGCKLAWLINPQDQQVEIDRPDRLVETLNLPQLLSAKDVLPSFTLDLMQSSQCRSIGESIDRNERLDSPVKQECQQNNCIKIMLPTVDRIRHLSALIRRPAGGKLTDLCANSRNNLATGKNLS